MNIRWIMLLLGMAGVAMIGQLLLSDGGFSRTQSLRHAVLEQRTENAALRERNVALEAEVLNLKNGRAAAEERARTDLGMIGKSETFYQVVPAKGDRLVADASVK
ncbi:MAG: septum formation initiator family protein [Woeseiaceae bacterium]